VSKRLYLWLLAVPFAATLIPPFYARRAPELFGFPFFYWYQIAWVVISALIVWFVFVKTRGAEHE
jgi:hypothetical protein